MDSIEAQYEKFSQFSDISQWAFLRSLSNQILDGKLSYVNPAIVKELVSQFAERKRFVDLEGMIVRLDITCLDIHQVMTLCWKEGLYDAIIYIHNRAFNEYVAPLEQFLEKLQAGIASGKPLTDKEVLLGNKILVYISCCLSGRFFSNFDLTEDRKEKIRKDTVACLTKFKSENKEPGTNKTSIYPHLKTLLYFDTREFLNVLTIAFEEQDFEYDSVSDERQRIIDILLHVMVQSAGFSPTQVGALFTFLARQLAKPKNSALVNKMLFDQVVEYLTNPNDTSRIDERQQALLELIRTEGMIPVDDEKLLTFALKAKFYQICEYIHLKNRAWDKMLDCYLLDPAKQSDVFGYIHRIMSNRSISLQQKEKFAEVVQRNIAKLTDIDNIKTSLIIVEYFSSEDIFETIIDTLRDQPQCLYKLLHGFFLENHSHKRSASTDSKNSGLNISPNAEKRQVLLSAASLQETYVALMCQFEPNKIYETLKRLEGYRIDIVLESCRQYNAIDGVIYLLERRGQFKEAFEILFGIFKTSIQQVNEHFSAKEENEKDVLGSLEDLEKNMKVIISFCQRCSSFVPSEERESFWFDLFEEVMCLQEKINSTKDSESPVFQKLRFLIRLLLNGTMGHINLLTLLQKILSNPVYVESGSKLCELRELLLTLLDTYNYEETLLNTTTSLLEDDLHGQLVQLTKTISRGNSGRSPLCSICWQRLAFDDTVFVFRCSHSFHASCLDDNIKTSTDRLATCPKCDSGAVQLRHINPRELIRRVSSEAKDALVSETKQIAQNVESLDDQQIAALDYLRKCQRAHPIKTDLRNASSNLQIYDTRENLYRLKLSPSWNVLSFK